MKRVTTICEECGNLMSYQLDGRIRAASMTGPWPHWQTICKLCLAKPAPNPWLCGEDWEEGSVKLPKEGLLKGPHREDL